jgi:diguanylate cyclase (GGDEF)-like protein
MPTLDPVQAKVLRRAAQRFRGTVRDELVEPVREHMKGFSPREFHELLQEVVLVEQQLATGAELVEVHDVHASLLKAIVVSQRRAMAAEADGPRQRTANRDAIHFLEQEVRVLDTLIAEPWMVEVAARRLPRLTDYFAVRWAERVYGMPDAIAPRVGDEKFDILEAPRLFLPDLAHYRGRCALRNATIVVAYLDIDDFKRFNTEYGESRVDRDLLPAFMEALEAHVFGHGHAYRFGGDEYIVLMPNTTAELAAASMRRFQAALRRLSLVGIKRLPTVSVGLCHCSPQCVLTDREVAERANRAKAFAKTNPDPNRAGKSAIALYEGELFRPEDLRIVADPDPV